MDRLTAAEVFITIVERGSMIGAADALDMSRSMVTRYLAQMESWAGTRLLHRSTRRLSLTAAGEHALIQCQRLREITQEVESGLGDSNDNPRGHLRISCSQVVAQSMLFPTVQTYLNQYPDVSVDLVISNEVINLVEERIDLAVRITNALDPNIIARPLGQCDSVLCASPEYLQQRGTPSQPDQLRHHNCLVYANFGKSIWELSYGEEQISVPVSGTLSANDTSFLLCAVRQHSGISMLPLMSVAAELAKGDLMQVLPDYQPPTLGIYGIYRSRTHMPQALRLLIDQLVIDFSSCISGT